MKNERRLIKLTNWPYTMVIQATATAVFSMYIIYSQSCLVNTLTWVCTISLLVAWWLPTLPPSRYNNLNHTLLFFSTTMCVNNSIGIHVHDKWLNRVELHSLEFFLTYCYILWVIKVKMLSVECREGLIWTLGLDFSTSATLRIHTCRNGQKLSVHVEKPVEITTSPPPSL